MRLPTEIANYIKSGLSTISGEARVYLFGSRTDDNLKGGDIDILLLTSEKVSAKKIRAFKSGFYSKFGWQKIDIINFTFNQDHTFKDIAQKNAIEL